MRASRLVIDGIVKPAFWTACVKSSSLTDGTRRRLMMPPSKTVGTNVNCTPKGLYSVVMIGNPPAARLRRRHRKFAARQKGRGVTGECNQVRLCQASDEALGFQCGQSNVEAAPLGGETGQRDAKRHRSRTRNRREQSRRSIEYRKARCPGGTGFPLASTQGGVPRPPKALSLVRSQVCPPRRTCPGRSRSLGSPRCLPQTNSPRFRGSRCGRPQEIGP